MNGDILAHNPVAFKSNNFPTKKGIVETIPSNIFLQPFKNKCSAYVDIKIRC